MCWLEDVVNTQKQHTGQNAEHHARLAQVSTGQGQLAQVQLKGQVNTLASGMDKFHSQTPEMQAHFDALKLHVRASESQADDDAQMTSDKKRKDEEAAASASAWPIA